MKKIIFALLLAIVSLIGFNNSFADQYIYEYRDLGNDMTLKMTYEPEDMRLVDVEVIYEE